MADGGQIAARRAVVPPGNGPDSAKLRDLNMLVQNKGGRERTGANFGNCYAKAGFTLTRIYPTEGELSIIEAVRASDTRKLFWRRDTPGYGFRLPQDFWDCAFFAGRTRKQKTSRTHCPARFLDRAGRDSNP